MTLPPYDTGPAGPAVPDGSSPPGFGPVTQPWQQGHPLADAKEATRKRFLMVMGFFAVLLVVSLAGFVLTAGDDVKRTAANIGDRIDTFRSNPPVATPTKRVAPPSGPVVPEPVTYRGRGNRTLKLRRPEPGAALVYIKGTGGSRLFSATGHTSNGTHSGFVVATIGAYEGVRLLDVADVVRTTTLKIEAVGPWIVEIRSARAARSYAGGTITGHGDSVVRYTGRAGTAHVRGGTQMSAFTVMSYGANGFPNPIVIAVGAHDGREDWPAGPVLVEVKAVGRWSIRVG